LISKARLLQVGATIVGRVPRWVDPLLWSVAGTMSYLMKPSRRGVVRENQRLALRARFGTKAVSSWRLEHSTYKAHYYYARYWVEILRLGTLGLSEVVLSVDTVASEEFVTRRLTRQPTIAVLAHVGNWEWGGAWVSLACNGVTAVAERLEDPAMTQWFLDARRRLGMEIVLTGGDVARSLLRALREGDLVALLVDRDISGTGEPVEFLGQRVPLSSGPGVLSVMSGVPIFPVGTYQRRGGRQEVRFFPPIYPPNEGTRAERVGVVMRDVAAAIEAIVQEEPGQWHNFQPYEPVWSSLEDS
jgi:lauroyl/myristoyl acyltransferase